MQNQKMCRKPFCPCGEVSSPTYSPRCEIVAAAMFTQVRIYRVYIDDRSSDSAGVCTQATASFKISVRNI